MFIHGHASLQLFWGVWILLIPWVSFVMTDEFSVRITKLASRIDVSWTHSLPFYYYPILTQWIKVILPKGCKPGNFESHNSLKLLSFTNIQGLLLNFVDCESFLKPNSSDFLSLCGTNLDDSIDSVTFSLRGYLPLIQKDSTNHIHGLTVYVNEGLPLARNLSQENSVDSYLCFWMALPHSVSYFFFFSRSPSLSSCMVFDFISSKKDEFLSINPSTVFEVLTPMIRTG